MMMGCHYHDQKRQQAGLFKAKQQQISTPMGMTMGNDKGKQQAENA